MAKTYLQSVSHFSEGMREEIIEWTTCCTRFERVPKELAFLHLGCVDLGFENLGLSEADLRTLLLAFVGDGVAVPGRPYRLRYSGVGMATVVEPATGQELPLPAHWRQGLYVVDPHDRLTWIGKRVRPEQVGPFHLALYQDVGDAWQLRSDP